MNFLRNLLAAILGTMVAIGILIVMLLVLGGLVASRDNDVHVKEASILEIQLQQPIADYTAEDELNPFADFLEEPESLEGILHAIRVAKNDTKIKGISINNNFLLTGLAQTQTIRKALEDFKSEGKFIYAYADFYPQKDYYLASVADSLFINPVGAVDFKGLSSEVLFFKDLQEKTGVKMEVIRHGKYKSAVEPFLENEMSVANRTQIKELLHSLWNAMVTDIAKGRGTTAQDLNIIADTLGGRSAKLAKTSGLVDGSIFYDEYESKISKALNVKKTKDINYIALNDYVTYARKKSIKSGKDKVAVVFAQGEIIYGEGGPDIIGQGLIMEALRTAREDAKVKAVVLRINSPGGSALTSDIIWREVVLTKKVKPVVVSMGDVAASGGYYIAAGADKIYAEPTTITGSIGVFGVLPNASTLAGNIGVNAEQVGTNKNAVGYSFFEPLDAEFKDQIQESIETTYHTFLERVAAGRNITIAQADSLAQGRIWSGVDAKRIGLVDALGTLEDAIEAAAELAKLDTYGIKKLPKYKTSVERFMKKIGDVKVNISSNGIVGELGTEAVSTVLEDIKATLSHDGVQARMPCVLNIK